LLPAPVTCAMLSVIGVMTMGSGLLRANAALLLTMLANVMPTALPSAVFRKSLRSVAGPDIVLTFDNSSPTLIVFFTLRSMPRYNGVRCSETHDLWVTYVPRASNADVMS
jgi:hypothetical protein